MKTTNRITISNEEAIVLQQISESGEGEDLVSSARGLRMHRSRVMQHLEHLKHKGLITIKATYGDWWGAYQRRRHAACSVYVAGNADELLGCCVDGRLY